MSLSKASTGLLSRCVYSLVVRRAASKIIATRPQKAARQLTIPSTESGYFNYERDFSRDSRYSQPQKTMDTPWRFLTAKLSHAYEVYPIFFLTGWWFVLFCFTTFWSFEKIEVWLDRSADAAPWDWERSRDNYWKKPTLLFDLKGESHKRCELMEALQDEMLEASKKLGKK